LWLPLAKLQDGLGGKARFILTLVGLAVVALVAAMILVPYPLKMDAKGQLLPIQRAYVYPAMDGQIQEIKADLKPGTPVRKGQELIRMHNSELAKQVQDLVNEINNETKTIGDLSSHSDPEKRRESVMARTRRDQRQRQLDDLRQRTNAILQRPG